MRPLLEDRGRITESIRILVPVDKMKQKCFQITTKQVIPKTAELNERHFLIIVMGVDHGGWGTSPPIIWSGGIVPQILSCCKIFSLRLLSLQCRKVCFLPLQQDFYSKSRHASLQNSSQIYAYDHSNLLYKTPTGPSLCQTIFDKQDTKKLVVTKS